MAEPPSAEGPRSPREAAAAVRVTAPSERNRKLARMLEAANANAKLKARWHATQVTAERLGMSAHSRGHASHGAAERLGMSDHSWVHLRIVLNSALRLFRLLHAAGVRSSVEVDYG